MKTILIRISDEDVRNQKKNPREHLPQLSSPASFFIRDYRFAFISFVYFAYFTYFCSFAGFKSLSGEGYRDLSLFVSLFVFLSMGDPLVLFQRLLSFMVLIDSIVLGSLAFLKVSQTLTSLGLSFSMRSSLRLLKAPIYQ